MWQKILQRLPILQVLEELESHTELDFQPQIHMSKTGGNGVETKEGLLSNEKRIFHSQVWKVRLLQHLDYLVCKVNMHSFNKCLLKPFYMPFTQDMCTSVWGKEQYE